MRSEVPGLFAPTLPTSWYLVARYSVGSIIIKLHFTHYLSRITRLHIKHSSSSFIFIFIFYFYSFLLSPPFSPPHYLTTCLYTLPNPPHPSPIHHSPAHSYQRIAFSIGYSYHNHDYRHHHQTCLRRCKKLCPIGHVHSLLCQFTHCRARTTNIGFCDFAPDRPAVYSDHRSSITDHLD